MSINYDFLGVPNLTGDRKVTISNYGRANVSYSVQLSNGGTVQRDFAPMIKGRAPHSIVVSFDELYQLSQKPGGKQLIFDNLYTDDMEVRKALGLPYDKEELPEIGYTRDDVSRIVKEGTDDEIKDLVEFGIGAGLHYIAEWIKEDSITVDSSSRKELIGKMLNINPDGLADLTEWLAEDAQAGTLGFYTINGVEGKQASASHTTTRRRRAQSNTEASDGQNQSFGGVRRSRR